MRLREPVTMATDYLVALMAVLCAALLLRHRVVTYPTVLWSCGLMCLAVAALSGGTFHGVGHAMRARARSMIWKLTTTSVGLAGSLMLAGTVVGSTSAPILNVALSILGVELVAYIAWVARRDAYRWVILDSAGKLFLIAGLAGWQWVACDASWAPWMLGGVTISSVAAAIQASGVSLYRHLNHNDLYHLVQIAGIYLFYRGAQLFSAVHY